MDPRIEFTRTSDGVDIAFWSQGEGPPLVMMPSMPWSHLKEEWAIPEVAHWFNEMGRGRRLIRYDGRGFGLSQRQVDDYGLDAQVRDLEAVIARAGLDRFDLYAAQHSGPPAIAYAVAHPDRVSHLILFCAYADGNAYGHTPVTYASRGMIEHDWDFYTEAVARLLLGWKEPEAASRFAAMVRASTGPEVASAVLNATLDIDVRDLLERVSVPTLVVFRPELRSASFEQSRLMASAIPGARLVLLEGESVAPYLGDVDAVVNEIGSFLSGDAPTSATSPGSQGGLRTILFTDIEGSSALTSRLGDDGAREVLRDHERAVRSSLREHGGTEIKTMGDGFMASFGSAVAAVECAIDLQRTQAEANATAREPIRIRVGMNAGEPIAEDDDLFGTAVIAAARIGAAAAPGEILAADVVRQLVKGKGFRFEDRGETSLRGLDEPVRIHAVVWQERTAR
jgi:class 3 adenylate cyclase